jgi:hypothetical protein
VTTFTDHTKSATIQVSNTRTGERHSIPCVFQSMEGKRLNLVSRDRLAASTVISVEYNDAMFLGEVLACTQDCKDTWHTEVKVEQILTGLQSLMNLRARLLGEGAPQAITMSAPVMVPVGAAR